MVIVIVDAGFAWRFRDRDPASGFGDPASPDSVVGDPPAAGIVIEKTEPYGLMRGRTPKAVRDGAAG